MPDVAAGRRAGTSTSNRPRAAPGSVHNASVVAERVGPRVRGRAGRPNEHDPEVLRDVARVLDRPVGVVAERRVAVRLRLVQVLVGRVEDVRRWSRGCTRAAPRPGMRRAEAGRQPAPPPAAADRRRARRTAPRTASCRRAVHASPNRSPMRNWRPSTASAVSRAEASRGPAAASGRRPRPRSSTVRLGSAPIARRPTASRANPTATTWARYQVVPSCAVYQKTVPKAKKAVAAIRTQKRSGSRPSIHQPIPTSSAARHHDDDLPARGQPARARRTARGRGRAAAGTGSARAGCRRSGRPAARRGSTRCPGSG